ncbi:uncharacterized protein N7477_004390 [Penicillium maclennaniae]|uniref:uncharacterized protein n=1 Tax=Penicillium maclennaniae TaxID=1343394 RepID=UPI00253F8E40|nr:uncharacterized protein N7477_004390 [Penicillium maclennaniae]KAJ5674456.1 hypothetical protein N7477_004390 [Penicillium maclennaniae]
MPPRRHAAAAAQSTLSFGNQSRVTKPSTTPATLHKGKTLDSPLPTDKSASGTPEPQQVLASEPSKPHIAEVVVRQQATKEHEEPLSAEDKRALKLTKQDLQKYWNKEERSRKAPRVHQQDLYLEEKILRHFDLCSQYGPCIGIARLKRWRRANMLKLNPPIEVLAVLLKKQNANERAHVDELLS